MTTTFQRTAVIAVTATFVLSLAGCATKPTTLYQWEGYQAQIYEHFKGGSLDQQIAELERGLQAISAHGTTPPPGYHAHLGMLYSESGKSDLALAQFNDELRLFPESAAYMEFLSRNMKREAR